MPEIISFLCLLPVFFFFFILPYLLKMRTKESMWWFNIHLTSSTHSIIFPHFCWLQPHPSTSCVVLSSHGEQLVCCGPYIPSWTHLPYIDTVGVHCSQMYKTALSDIKICFGVVNQIIQISVYNSPVLIITILPVVVLCTPGAL